MPLHLQLERLIREWAKDIQATEPEVVFEAPLSVPDSAVALVVAKLSDQSSVWFLLSSTRSGEVEILPVSLVETVISSACAENRMISFVDPLTGGGLTIDVSDEGGPTTTLQVAGWGACARLATELGQLFPEVYWLR